MAGLLVYLMFVVLGSLLCQIIALTCFVKNEMELAWFGYTLATESLIFGLVPGFTNEFVFWMSEIGLIVGMLSVAYTISEGEYLPKNINKILYFYPTLPKIKFHYQTIK